MDVHSRESTRAAAAADIVYAAKPGSAPRGRQERLGSDGIAATAVFCSSDVASLFQLHAGQLVDGLTNPLYAPVLVDHYIGPNTP